MNTDVINNHFKNENNITSQIKTLNHVKLIFQKLLNKPIHKVLKLNLNNFIHKKLINDTKGAIDIFLKNNYNIHNKNYLIIQKKNIDNKLLLSSINSINSYIKNIKIKNKKNIINNNHNHNYKNNMIKCKCGFWGDITKNNLCSICFQKKNNIKNINYYKKKWKNLYFKIRIILTFSNLINNNNNNKKIQVNKKKDALNVIKN